MADKAPEGGNANPNQPPAPVTPPAPQVDVAALTNQLNQVQQRLMEQDAIIQAAAASRMQQVQGDGGEPPLPQGQEGDAVQKLFGAYRKEMEQRQQMVENRVDYQDFQSHVREQGDAPDIVQEAEKLYSRWVQGGVKIGTATPSRKDALRYVRGWKAEEEAAKAKGERVKAEEQRRAGNVNATLETGGRGRRNDLGLDPEKMSRSERLEKYYPAVLDEEGF